MIFLLRVAWRNLWRHRRRSLITAGAMAVGASMCLSSSAFNDGMYEQLFEVMVEQQLGHVQLHHPEWPGKKALGDTLPDAERLLATIDAADGTLAAAARLHGYALVGGESDSTGALLMGVDPARERRASPVAERVVSGRFLADAQSAEILLGERLARDLDLAVGGTVVAVTQSADGSLGNALYTVVGTVRSGNAQMDRMGAWLHLADAQELFVVPDQVHEITVVTTDVDAIAPYAERLRAAVGSDTIRVATWWEASPQAAQLMGMRDAGAFVFIVIIFGAAAFGVANTMTMSVFERTRELGVLKALGMRPGRLVALIVTESVLLAGIAATLGIALGGFLDFLAVRYGIDFSASAEEGFSFAGVQIDPVIHGVVRWEPFVFVTTAVLVVSVLASLWPAWRASQLRPVEAIRAE